MEKSDPVTSGKEADNDCYTHIWQKVSNGLMDRYGKDLYKSWFSKITFIEIQGGSSVLLATPSNFIRDWIKSHYHDAILSLLNSFDARIKKLDIITKQLTTSDRSIAEQKTNIYAENQANTTEKKDTALSLIDPRFTFENFVVGPSNELAYAAALSVAESTEAVVKSNPLFLYGGVGLGKTHLMHAIALHSYSQNPDRKVLYMSAEKFMYRFIKALRNKDIMSFKDEFRSVDVLMIDDIQFICGKESTQEEFFHTFNAIIDNNKQMVISCDRSPTDLDNIEERIKSRLGWGLVADVHSTTYELRIGILEAKLEKMNIQISKDIIDFLASKITSNIRELEGGLNKVIAHSTLIGREITLESTQDILRDLLRSNERMITIAEIQKQVASRYNIRISEMSSARRVRSIARPRQIAMYLSKSLTSKSLADIGNNFGKKDHTTVMHAIRKIEELMSEDSDFREEISMLTKILQS